MTRSFTISSLTRIDDRKQWFLKCLSHLRIRQAEAEINNCLILNRNSWSAAFALKKIQSVFKSATPGLPLNRYKTYLENLEGAKD